MFAFNSTKQQNNNKKTPTEKGWKNCKLVYAASDLHAIHH